ncbi:MAG: GAF domain-containing protein [Candidatus Zixiibacteriota bacterium]|nr:MAG: GAF domain-containing protein [candidate division Zixibacteria bacterium]
MSPNRRQLIESVRVAIAEAETENEILLEAAKLIDGFSENHNWTGFYMLRNGVLEVEAYVGPETQHARIDLNTGICGAAASQKKTIIADDVRCDSRFLACSLSTRSEIVVPLMDGANCLGEIDIDSDCPGHFTAEDKEMLQGIATTVVERLKAMGLLRNP